MSIVDFIAVVSFGLTCFGLGYTLGKDSNKVLNMQGLFEVRCIPTSRHFWRKLLKVNFIDF